MLFWFKILHILLSLTPSFLRFFTHLEQTLQINLLTLDSFLNLLQLGLIVAPLLLKLLQDHSVRLRDALRLLILYHELV